jgi:hypothetical protein
MPRTEEQRLANLEKVKAYYYAHREVEIEKHQRRYYAKKAISLGLDVDGLSLADIKYKLLLHKVVHFDKNK